MSSLIRWSPLGDSLTRSPFREMSRVMDDFFRLPLSDLTQATYPLADVAETGDAYTVTVEVPGIRKEDIQLSVQENILSLRVTKQSEKDEDGRKYRHVERFYGTFERHFPFSSSIDPEHVKASYSDGVLEIVLAKAENARKREIAIAVK
jgi:HSP20 family protein